MNNQPNPPLELWGGVEGTFNRVGDRYFNQLEWNGHAHRADDLELFAELGFKALRYPILWESLAPETPEEINWDFPDERLNRLHELNIRPIVGLVHHGSGPRYANIATSEFASGLANYARRVAERYPWLDAYTPVNEPLTTARFCGLYGHWHPHGQDTHSFIKILLNECRAVSEAMFAIREINPKAQLIQTEDLGRIYSTQKLSYQADFENERRWLSFDLISGRIDKEHSMWDFLVQHGAPLETLDWFCEHPCLPNVIGINHYPTSDRFLDHRFDSYPGVHIGGNGREQYVDVEAIRVLPTPPYGFKERLCEAWERYQLPLAITEAHLGCTREEQVRWFSSAWRAAKELREGNIPVKAVTAWSLLGAWNWNSLVTRDENYYEPGVFDIRGPKPRPTAIANLLYALGNGQEYSHPIINHPGWWERPFRTLGTPPDCLMLTPPVSWATSSVKSDKFSRPLLILGKTGSLGQAFAKACDVRGLPYYLLSRQEVDICDPLSIERALDSTNPWAVINATGYACVDEAEADPETCFRINSDGATNLAEICARRKIGLVCFSSDLVFDGFKQSPYIEEDATSPLGIFGKSKSSMEKRVMAACPTALIARTSHLFGPWSEKSFVAQTLRTLSRGGCVTAPRDTVVSPTYMPDFVTATLDLLVDGAHGIWHLTNGGGMSWSEVFKMTARQFGFQGKIRDITYEEMDFTAPRPRVSALESSRGQFLPLFDEAIARYQHDLRI
jgi:dTDP-4-dehydrorhamnose reductase